MSGSNERKKAKNRPHCAGIIVINGNETILVKNRRGNYSFPKGKIERGESIIDAAWRELQEETGLTSENIELVGNGNEFKFIDEYSSRGNLSIRYFIGKLIKNVEKFTFDPQELQDVQFFKIEDISKLNNLRENRKTIAVSAFTYCSSISK